MDQPPVLFVHGLERAEAFHSEGFTDQVSQPRGIGGDLGKLFGRAATRENRALSVNAHGRPGRGRPLTRNRRRQCAGLLDVRPAALELGASGRVNGLGAPTLGTPVGLERFSPFMGEVDVATSAGIRRGPFGTGVLEGRTTGDSFFGTANAAAARSGWRPDSSLSRAACSTRCCQPISIVAWFGQLMFDGSNVPVFHFRSSRAARTPVKSSITAWTT